jgi:hypothetical protein
LNSYIKLFYKSSGKNKAFIQKQIAELEPTFSIHDLLKEKDKLLTEKSLYPDNRYSQESRSELKACSTVIALGQAYFETVKKREKRFLFTEPRIGEFLNQKIFKQQHRYLL